MVVVIDSSVPGRVAHLLPAWRKYVTMTRRPTSTIVLIGLSETNTIGSYACTSSGALLITSRFSALLASAAFVKLKEPVMTVALSITRTLLSRWRAGRR